jgi:SAM-dependent methyltransferase
LICVVVVPTPEVVMPRRAFAVAPLVLATACATPQSATTTSSCPADCPRHAEGSVHHGAGKHDGSGPRSGHGDHDGKGPNHGEGKHDGTGPRAGRGGHDGSGAHDGRGGHRGGGMPHRFENALEWAKRFDAPERDAWQKPDDVVAALKLPADALIADVGAGTGYFAVRLARAVPGGRVVALDVENDMVRYVSERAANEGLKNLVARLTPADRADVDAGTDVVLVVDTYHHIDNRTAYFAALKSRLSPRGRVVIVDFKPDSERGPPRDHKLSPDVVKSELAAAGYAQVAQHDFLPDQYVLEFAPKPAG